MSLFSGFQEKIELDNGSADHENELEWAILTLPKVDEYENEVGSDNQQDELG